MIAAFLPGSWLNIDAACNKPFCRKRVEQQMIDPNAGIAFEGITPVIPIGIHGYIGVQVAGGIGPALRQQFLEGSVGERVGLLSHASLWVAGDPHADIAAIASFEEMLGFCGGYGLAAHATLRQIVAPAGARAMAWPRAPIRSGHDLARPRDHCVK
ncbi:hypothetical protein [Sphingopyxis solisilvae]|uniref:hypothetical protein n=1 Tax=Sphingopyxis solisilvae TaxID=1886788 RepID=UPI001892A517|nr:hypothetical protein [Sphingopyxis solisilvae]